MEPSFQRLLLLPDLLPRQQAAATVMRIGGSAREMIRGITPHELSNGGLPHDQRVGPIADIVAGLQLRF